MPSASPESRHRRHRRSRSRSKHRSKSASPNRKQHPKERHAYSRGFRETSPTSRLIAHPKSRPRSEERSTKRPTSRSNQDSRLEDSRHKPVSTKDERNGVKPRGDKISHRRHMNPMDRDQRKSRFERVRVKEEPVSNDEGRRRQRFERPERVMVKSEFGAGNVPQEDTVVAPKDKPNFGLSGKLAEDTNMFNGVVIKYSEPVEARKPNKKWRLYPFKGSDPLAMLPIHRQSAYLLGRDRKIADIPIDHPSCSKQHAVFQFRMVSYQREDGRTGRRVRPYIIDLESANGTFVNNNKIEARRYVELMEKDVLKFGYSSREYVLLHEGSSADDALDDVPEENAEGEGETAEGEGETAEGEGETAEGEGETAERDGEAAEAEHS